MINLLLVDDHRLFREGLVGLLDNQPDITVVGEAGQVREAVELAKTLKPDVILMDFNLPDGTGLDATNAILAEQPQINIIFLTIYEEDESLFAAIRLGAKGYLLKNVPVSGLLAFIRGVQRGEAAMSPHITARVLKEFAELSRAAAVPSLELSELTLREVEVLQELARGGTNREIADCLFITENTVKNHVRSILTKLNLKNRREAAHYARQHGLTQTPRNR